MPRAISTARTLRVAFRTRPQPVHLPAKTSRALNILYTSIAIFLVLSLKSPSGEPTDNIFITALARLSLPTDALYARLTLARQSIGGLTPLDEALRPKLTSRAGRELYLRFGPWTMANCNFCTVDDEVSWVLYHLPTNVLLPHLLHFLAVGMATSSNVGGWKAGRWRGRALLGVVALVVMDLYMLVGFEQVVDVNGPAPMGLFWVMRILRPLLLCAFDAILAAVIWASATNRLLMFGGGVTDEEDIKRRNMEMLNRSNVVLQTAQTKLRAANVVRNAVVRDRDLQRVENGYWRDVTEVEGRDGLGGGAGMKGVWENEDVQAALARAYGQGAIDVGRMRREAEGFVRGVTGGLGNGAAG